jgi:hypothetical protein
MEVQLNAEFVDFLDSYLTDDIEAHLHCSDLQLNFSIKNQLFFILIF